MFVEFTLPNGREIFVNHDLIQIVTAHPNIVGLTTMQLTLTAPDGSNIMLGVKESVQEVMESLGHTVGHKTDGTGKLQVI